MSRDPVATIYLNQEDNKHHSKLDFKCEFLANRIPSTRVAFTYVRHVDIQGNLVEKCYLARNSVDMASRRSVHAHTHFFPFNTQRQLAVAGSQPGALWSRSSLENFHLLVVSK